MAEQDNTPQGGFGQAMLLSYHDFTGEDAADIQALTMLRDPDRTTVLEVDELQLLLVTSAIAVVRRGEMAARGRIVALAECSYVHRLTGNVGLIHDIMIDLGEPSVVSGLQEMRIRMALIDCLLPWLDEHGIRRVDYLGPASIGMERDRLTAMGFSEIVEGLRYTRYRPTPSE